MHLEACIFDANSYQGAGCISFLLLARHWLLFFENYKISPWRIFGWPGGMRGGAGGDLRGVRDLQNLQFRASALDSTRQRLPYGKGGGFNRSAHSAGPGRK